MGSCLTFGNELSEKTHLLAMQETLLSGHMGGEKQGKEPRRLLSHVVWQLRFHSDVISFRLSLHDHSDSGSFLVVPITLSQDGFQQGFWEIGKMHRLESFLSLLTFPEFF